MAPTIDDLRARFSGNSKPERPNRNGVNASDPEACRICQGTGNVAVHQDQRPEAEDVWVHCYNCRGTGLTNGWECLFCQNLNCEMKSQCHYCRKENPHIPSLRSGENGSAYIRIQPIPHLEGSKQRLAGLPANGVIGTTTDLERAVTETLTMRLQPWMGSAVVTKALLMEMNSEVTKAIHDLLSVCTESAREVLCGFQIEAVHDGQGRINIRIDRVPYSRQGA